MAGHFPTGNKALPQIHAAHPLLGVPSIDPLGLGITWRNTLHPLKLLSLVDHQVPMPSIFPASGYVKMVAEASLKFSGSKILRKFELDDFFIENDIDLKEQDTVIEIILELQSTGSHERNGDRTDFFNFRIRTIHSSGNKLNALGCIRLRTSDGHKGLSLLETRRDSEVNTRYSLESSSTAFDHGTPTTSLRATSSISSNQDIELEPHNFTSRGVDGQVEGKPVVNHELEQYVQSSPRQKIVKTLPMSFGQSGFWFMSQLVGDPTFFNGTVSFLITANIDIELVSRLVREMASRHEGLRTAFFTDSSHQPKQGILAESPLYLETKINGSQKQLRTEIDAMNNHVYDLARGETLRLLLLTESAARHHLIVGYHHINIDGMSVIAITEELRLAYEGSKLPPPFQQNEFAKRQHERLRTGKYANDISFWKNEFQDLPEIFPILPISPHTLRSRPTARTTYRHVRAETRLNPAITAKLQGLRRQGYIQSPFNFYVTVFQILLSRLAQSEDICIGVASANRHNDPGSEDSIGIFLNLFPLRLRSQMSKSFLTLLEESKNKILAALNHSAVPFDVILNEVEVTRHPSYSPLFQAFINYIPTRESRSFRDGVIENNEYEIGETLYDIMLAVIDPPSGDPWIAFMVQKELYTEREAQILLDCFINLMDAFTRDIHLPGLAPQMFNGAAIQRAIQLGQGTSLDVELGSIHRFLENISTERASEIALQDTHGAELSYAEMMNKSARIAHALSASGISLKSRIGVLQEPTVNWICSMLGIWRFGGSYVPLEITHGAERLKSIMHDANVAAILIHDATRPLCEDVGGAQNAIIVDVDTTSGIGEAVAIDSCTSTPSDEAIVLYTSGSTGAPKGISLPHRMVTNTIKGFLQTFPMEPQTVLQQIALSFDVSWWQSLLGLATGGTVVVAGKDIRRDPFALTALIASHKITLTLAVPSEATSWLEHGDFLQLRQSAWEWHISAGEEIGNNLIEKIRRLEKLDLRLLNAYGPAETIIPNAHEILYRDRNLDISSIPIGKAMPNYSVYIIDQDYHPLPAGVPGQIVIGGAGVASGYINQPNLTATRFRKDALANAQAVAKGWIQAHLSGDRGYMREDGVFVALGRINGDTQVKLRGQRFELREVEVAMVTAGKGDILEAVCHIRSHNEKDAASAFLVAHVTLAQEVQNKYGTNGPVIDSMLRNVVSGLVLPQYMRPSFVVALPSMPLNHHGKVDRKFLSTSPLKKTAEALKLSPRFVQGRSAQFQNEMEEIWRDALGDLVDNQKLEEGSDFFLIGGNSLLLIKVQSKIKERTHHDIPLVKLFEASTLGKMAAMLHDSQQDNDKEQPLRTSSEGKMKQIWLSVLSDLATEDIITSDADFFLIGGNSLLLIRVQNEVHKQFGVLFPLASLFEASKLGQMATLLDKLVTENDESRRSELDINWKDEVACHDQFPAVTSVASNHELTGGSPSGTIVVLTGATGFLGRHILQRLVSDDTVKEVHCIAIRDISKPLVGSPKVITYPGDLRDPLLGLSDDTARRVFSRASAIIHNGADVSFLRSYWTLRAANVLSTKALVRLAMKHAIDKSLLHFHFVSTAGVVQLGTDELYEEAISASQPQKNANGYIVSKWASEKYLENVHAGSGLSVTIHRPTYVLGPDAPQLDVMHNILSFAERLRSVPHMPSVDRWLQFVGIDDVAQDIVTEVLDIRDGQGVNLQYRNHCGVESNWVRLDQLALFLERQHGAKFSKVDFADWIESAGRAGMPVQVKEYLTNLMVSSETNNHVWTSPRVLKGPRNIIAPWRKKGRL